MPVAPTWAEKAVSSAPPAMRIGLGSFAGVVSENEYQPGKRTASSKLSI